MHLRYCALAALAVAASSAWAGPEPQPPKRGEQISYGNGWRSPLINFEPRVTPIWVSTYDPPEGYYVPTKKPNIFEDDEEEGEKEGGLTGLGNIPGAQTSANEVGITTEPLVANFAGIPETTLTPPDNCLAVGPNQIILTVNSTLRILDKCGNTITTSTIQDFLNRPGKFIFDPKCMYDPWRGRYVMMWHEKDATTQESYLLLCISATGNATGSWYYYAFNAITQNGTADEAWADYYDLGYSARALYAAGNQFRWNNSFRYSTIRTWDPAEVYNAVAAVMVTNSNMTNADGTQTHTPRVVRMLTDPGLARDCFFVNSRRTGGDKLTLWTMNDPLGAHTLTRSDFSVNAYSLPPNSDQPGRPASLDTIDNRLMPAYYINVDGTRRIFTSLNCEHPTNAGIVSSRLYMINADTPAAILDWNYWHTDADTWFASPSVNFKPSCNWVFTHSSSASNPAVRYVNWEPTGFTNTTAVIKSGESAYSGSRWGDYFQGDVDWGDFANYGTSAQQKMWLYGEYGASGGNWGTWFGATVSDGVTAGAMSVSPGTGVLVTGYRGGPFAPANSVYNLSNTGMVGYGWELTGVPSWLTASDTTGQVFDSVVPVTLSTNGVTNSRQFGVYSQNMTFQNCYSNATAVRGATLEVSEQVSPSTVTVELGRIDAGNAASLANPADGNALRVCKFLVPNQQVAPVTFRVDGTLSGTSPLGSVRFWTRSRVDTAGSLSQTLDLWNWNTNNWDTTDVSTVAIGTSYSYKSVTGTGALSRYLNGARNLRARIRVRTTGPTASINWCGEFDHAYWDCNP